MDENSFSPRSVLPRLDLFEFNDQPWVPSAVRDSVVECLNHIVRRRGIVQGMIPPLMTFLNRTKATRIIDLCSGAGGPALIFAEEMKRQKGRAPRIVLTDLFPRVDTWEAARRAHPDTIEFCPEPVDATGICEELSAGCPRMINNAFHVFPPPVAEAVLRDAADNSAGIFITEMFPRNLARFVAIMGTANWAILGNPVLASKQNFAKALLTWLLPVVPFVTVWDGLVSLLRVYTEDEFRKLVAPLGDRFQWVYGTYRHGRFGIATYFYGVPRC